METNQLLLQPGPAAGVPVRADAASTQARSALGYLEAAEALLEYWKKHPREALALPVLDAYRISADLALKDAIRLAACCLRAEGARGADVNPGILEARMSAYTTAESLLRHFVALLGRVPLGAELSARALEMLRNLVALDAANHGAVLVRRESDGRRSLVSAGAGVRRDADLEAVGAVLAEAIMLLAGEICGALTRFLVVHDVAAT